MRKKIEISINRLAMIVLLIVLTINLSSCKKVEYLDNPIALGYRDGIYYIINQDAKEFSLEEYDDVKQTYGDYLMVQKKGKWGYIKNTGEQVTKIKYDTVYPMTENKAVVTLDGITSIINNKGEIIYTFDKNVTSVSSFKDNYLVIEKDGLFGYLKCNDEKTVETAIEPKFNYASRFNEGYAGVGRFIDGALKYSYINTEGTLLTTDYLWDYIDEFNNSFAKVGTKNSSGSLKYNYISFKNNTITYLAYNGTNVEADYASSFNNNVAFIADYKRYEQDLSQVYKWFEIIDVNGQKNYTELIETYAKKKPKDFFPHNSIFINNCLIIENSDRNRCTWEILYDSTFYYAESEDTYHQFANAVWDIKNTDPVIIKSVESSAYSEQLFLKNLQTPIELGKFIFNHNLNAYICMSKTNENKCGIVTVQSTPPTITMKNCADDFQITVSYIIPTIYDEIIY